MPRTIPLEAIVFRIKEIRVIIPNFERTKASFPPNNIVIQSR